jgi:hypothetical protein
MPGIEVGQRVLGVALVLLAPLVSAQTPQALTVADYARAERLAGYNANPLPI